MEGGLCERGIKIPSPKWPLKWAVCILLGCIVVRDNFHIFVFLPTTVSYQSSIV